jgi:hypothetical protein
MKLFPLFAAAALTLAAAPAKADVYSHSFPGVGPTGTYCTTIINGTSGSTSCSRGLTDAEKKADQKKWNGNAAKALVAQGLPANYCVAEAAKAHQQRLANHNQRWAHNPVVLAMVPGSVNRWADQLACEGEAIRGTVRTWKPFLF